MAKTICKCLQMLPYDSFKYTRYLWLDSNSYLSPAQVLF